MKKLLLAATLIVGTVVGLGVASEPDGTSTKATTRSGGSTYSHELLQRDATMTQRMSTPNADGPMQRGEVDDAQLDHSQDAGFVRALEQHQAEIDRMLARPGQ